MSHIIVLNHVFEMNVAVIQRRNGYNQYYFALDSTFFEANLTRPRPGRGQLVEAKAETEARILASRSVWPRDLNVTGERWLVDIDSDAEFCYKTAACALAKYSKQNTVES